MGNDVAGAAGARSSENSGPGVCLPGRMIPLLLGLLAVAAIMTVPGMIVLAIVVALPAAFRIWIVLCPVTTSVDAPSLSTTDEEEPVYSIIAPLRAEAKVVDQLLKAIERLNYPSEKLDVIIAVEADDDGSVLQRRGADTPNFSLRC